MVEGFSGIYRKQLDIVLQLRSEHVSLDVTRIDTYYIIIAYLFHEDALSMKTETENALRVEIRNVADSKQKKQNLMTWHRTSTKGSVRAIDRHLWRNTDIRTRS